MRIWADACVTPTLEDVAQARGYEATCNRTRGMLSTSDSVLFATVSSKDWVFVTSNEKDFVALARAAELHAGLIAIPQSTAARQRFSLEAVMTYIEDHASECGESAADWMVCRMVIYDDRDDVIHHEWLPDPPS